MGIETPVVEAWTPDGSISPSQIALAHLAVRQNQEREGTNIFSDITDTQADLVGLEQNYIANGGNFFTAGSEGGQLEGFVGLRNHGDGHGELKRLAVLPEFEGLGVGRALVATLIDWAHENEFTRITLETGGDEHARTRIYEKIGFVITGVAPKEHKTDGWLMELSLDA